MILQALLPGSERKHVLWWPTREQVLKGQGYDSYEHSLLLAKELGCDWFKHLSSGETTWIRLKYLSHLVSQLRGTQMLCATWGPIQGFP